MNVRVEPSEAVGMSQERLARIAPAMQAYVDQGVFAGVSTLVARRGRIVHAAEFGWRDREAGAPMTADTIFRLYSMTKPIVCTALMTLLEEGKFSLIDPVAKWIPAFATTKVRAEDGSLVAPKRPMTVGDLMAHTSGISYHFVENGSPLGKAYAPAKLFKADDSLATVIDDLAQFPLAFQPGSQWRYSLGIDVAARVAEAVSGKPLRTLLKERLLDPLGMIDTDFGVPAAKRDRVSAMYGRPDILLPEATMTDALIDWSRGVNDRVDVSVTYPVDRPDVFVRGGHGLFGTIGDYFRFAQMLLNGGELEGKRFIGRKTLELMHANRIPASMLPLEIGGLPLPGYGFGLGSRVLLDVALSNAPGSVGEFGWSGAAKTHYWVDPREQIVGLFMAQSIGSFHVPELDLRALAYQAIVD